MNEVMQKKPYLRVPGSEEAMDRKEQYLRGGSTELVSLERGPSSPCTILQAFEAFL